MSWSRLTCLLLLSLPGAVRAGEEAVFTPPQAYPVQRYEAGWAKNPFTLKTAERLVAQGSFAKDLAIGSHYGAADNPTVVVVNTKTSERILLRKDRPGPGGMRLKSFQGEINRDDCLAEITLGTEAAMIRYDTNYLGQMAANEVTRMAAAKQSVPSRSTTKPLILPKIPLPAVTPTVAPSMPTTGGRQTLKASAMTPPQPATMVSTTSAPQRVRFASPVLPLPKPIR